MTTTNERFDHCRKLLSFLYPQFEAIDFEITIASVDRPISIKQGITTRKLICYVAVWVKRVVDGRRVWRLHETCPERGSPEGALKRYIDMRLDPGVSELAEKALRTTRMAKMGTGDRMFRVAEWPELEAQEARLNPAAANPPPPTYSQVNGSRSSVDEFSVTDMGSYTQ